MIHILLFPKFSVENFPLIYYYFRDSRNKFDFMVLRRLFFYHKIFVIKDLSVLPMEKCLTTKYDQTFCINRDLKIKTNDGIYIEIYIVDSCKNLIEFEKINDNISELQLRFGN